MTIFRIDDILPDVYKVPFFQFLNFYSPDVIAYCPSKIPPLKPRPDRVCRFCGQNASKVKFQKDAHVIPEFLGNKYLIQDAECDDCNSKFSRYETSFANHLGLIRTTDMIPGKRGIPKFKSHGIIAFPEKDESGNLRITIEATDESSSYNAEDDTLLIKTTKTPYIPLHVMKCLFRIGFAILPENELDDYAHLKRIINTTELDPVLSQYCNVIAFTFSKFVLKPFAISFKKRSEFQSAAIPTKVIVLYFGRFMYEFILLNSKDEFMIKKGGQGKAYFCPPYWNKNYPLPDSKTINLSDPRPVKEAETYLFNFN